MNSPLLLDSATRLAERIRTRETSAVAVVDAHILAIEAVNPSLNAVVAERFAEARAEAVAADARVVAGEADLPPLLGVPCTIKESFELIGMPQAAGLVARRTVRSTGDATVVARWRAAGAIPLGVTNTSELNMWMESNNRVYGRSNNPYNRTRIVGGSSGGEGAIVGSGASPFGLGADIGGSIRMPAFFNGVFGHKPTPGLVPNSGQYPIAEGAALRLLGTGPICRRAEDLYPLVRLASGPDGIDATTRALPLLPPSLQQIEGLQVVVIQGNGLRRVSAEPAADGSKVCKRCFYFVI
jgi:fatty acid amide hydrolase 2